MYINIVCVCLQWDGPKLSQCHASNSTLLSRAPTEKLKRFWSCQITGVGWKIWSSANGIIAKFPSKSVCIYTYIPTNIHCIHIYIWIEGERERERESVYIYICLFICVWIYIYYIYIYVCVCIILCVNICICRFVYVCVVTWSLLLLIFLIFFVLFILYILNMIVNIIVIIITVLSAHFPGVWPGSTFHDISPPSRLDSSRC